MYKEMPVIQVNRVVDPKKNDRKKMEGRGGGESQGVTDQKNPVVKIRTHELKNIFSPA
jgi:hypothetical protein